MRYATITIDTFTEKFRKMVTQKCHKCGEVKEWSDFYKRYDTPSGYNTICKDCKNKKRRKYRAENREYFNNYTEQYWKDRPEKLILCRKEYAQSKNGKAALKRRYKKHAEKYPLKIVAVNALNKAVIMGKISRGVCTICGAYPTEGHHSDYTKPLDVIWFCKEHHAGWHKRNTAYYPDSEVVV